MRKAGKMAFGCYVYEGSGARANCPSAKSSRGSIMPPRAPPMRDNYPLF